MTEDPYSNCAYKPLPSNAALLLQQVSAPKLLVAHLVLVHDAATKLIEELDKTFPGLDFHRETALFGAAIHDIGKAKIANELIEPGEEHETRGVALLRSMNVPDDHARLAYTHGHWQDANAIELEDLLVALADKCWKGKRVDDLERKITDLLSLATARPAWECFAGLDAIVESIARDADERLAWQTSFSAT